MAMHIEFVVPGPPISNQQNMPRGRANLAAWRSKVAGAVLALWGNPLLMGELKAIIINFYAGNNPTVDVDNMSKPILDVMQQIIYDDDRQIVQAEIAHLKIVAAFSIVGVPNILGTPIQAGLPFVYVRIEDPSYPYPLPK